MVGNSVIQQVLAHRKTKGHRTECNSVCLFGVLLAIAEVIV